MISRLFHAVDDFLIDRVFQPICDALRKLFGWTKETLMGISYSATVICLVPLCIFILNNELLPTLGWLMIAIIIYCSWIAIKFIRKGASKKDDLRVGSTALDTARVIMFAPRIASLLASLMIILAIPLWLIAAGLTIPFVLSTFLAGIIFNISALYFQACTDLPPGKTILAKAKERLAKYFARPIAAPQ